MKNFALTKRPNRHATRICQTDNIFIGRQILGRENASARKANPSFSRRYLDPKYSRWMSCDPKVAEYMDGKDADSTSGGIYSLANFNLYHYGQNNPIKYCDPTGLDDDLPKTATPEQKKAAQEMGADFGKTISDMPHDMTEFHFEKRDEKNNLSEFKSEQEAYDTAKGGRDGWRRETRDNCHQDHDGFAEEKFCNSDGREMVFDGKSIKNDSPQFVADPATMQTFNYVDPGEKPSNQNGNNNLAGWAAYIGKGIAHGVVDVAPYLILGNDRNDTSTFSERLSTSMFRRP